jgi:hypothetical protein
MSEQAWQTLTDAIVEILQLVQQRARHAAQTLAQTFVTGGRGQQLMDRFAFHRDYILGIRDQRADRTLAARATVLGFSTRVERAMSLVQQM